MKIIQTDNYDRESEPQVLVASNITNQHYADIMLDALQKAEGRYTEHWYKIVPDSHVLWRGMADLVGDDLLPEQTSTLDLTKKVTVKFFQMVEEEVKRLMAFWPKDQLNPVLVFDKDGAFIGLGRDVPVGAPAEIILPVGHKL